MATHTRHKDLDRVLGAGSGNTEISSQKQSMRHVEVVGRESCDQGPQWKCWYVVLGREKVRIFSKIIWLELYRMLPFIDTNILSL